MTHNRMETTLRYSLLLEAPGSETKREGERFRLEEREEGFDASSLSK